MGVGGGALWARAFAAASAGLTSGVSRVWHGGREPLWGVGAGRGCRPGQVDSGLEWGRLVKELAGLRALEQPACSASEEHVPPVRDDLLLRRAGD